jgi:LemA protein
MTMLVVLLVTLLIVAILVWGVWIYNLLVRDRHRVAAAWSDIDVQLKRRHDLIPKLVDAVQSYTAYEQATLQNLTLLRTRSQEIDDPEERGPVEAELSVNVQRLLALAEAYPDLKASHNFLDLQREITSIEQSLQHARRYYNGAVRNLNTRIDTFPDLLLARAFNYRYAAYFQLEDSV